MLLNDIFVRGNSEMLRRPLEAIDSVSKPNAGKTHRIISMKAVTGNFYRKAIGFIIEIGDNLQILRMAEAVGVFIAKTGDLTAIKILRLYWKEDKMVAKTGDDSFSFQIARVDKKLNTIPFSKIILANFLKGPGDSDKKCQFLSVPSRIDISKMLFAQKL